MSGGELIVPVVPRVLALLRPMPSDDDPDGATPVAWAVKLHDGSAITIPVAGRPSVTSWASVGDAEQELDVYAKPVREEDRQRWEGAAWA